jgi:HAMP domain-containing protein
MTAAAASEAACALSMARWGTSRLDRMVDEILERSDELGTAMRDRLRQVVDHDTKESHR